MHKRKLKPSILIFFFLFLALDSHADHVNCNLPIKKIILWGHKLHSHTHSYIHWAFHRTFEHLGYDAYWFDDEDDVTDFDFSNSLFITEGQVDQKIPVREDCFYILHNCYDNKYNDLFTLGRCITLQVYTHECLGLNTTKIDDFVYSNMEASKIYMPWATDLLPHEIEENKQNVCTEKNNIVVYIGTIGSGIYGNVELMRPFVHAARENGIPLYHLVNCSMEENISLVKTAYMAPAIQMTWQVERGYIPCRIFKNISYGAFGITNSETVYELFDKKIVYNPDTYQLFYDAKKKLDNLDINELLELMDFVKEKHTYVNRIQHLLTFLEEVYKSKNNR